MRLSYRLATISYCPDLTDANAMSLPIAVLSVGKDNGRWSAAAVGLDAKRLGLDPLSSAMLADVPHMIRRHVDATMKGLAADASPSTVLEAFRDCLKTSIYVSVISDTREVTLNEPRDVAGVLMKKCWDELATALQQLARQVPPRQSAWTPRVEPERLMEPPEQLFWQPPSPLQESAAV